MPSECEFRTYRQFYPQGYPRPESPLFKWLLYLYSTFFLLRILEQVILIKRPIFSLPGPKVDPDHHTSVTPLGTVVVVVVGACKKIVTSYVERRRRRIDGIAPVLRPFELRSRIHQSQRLDLNQATTVFAARRRAKKSSYLGLLLLPHIFSAKPILPPHDRSKERNGSFPKKKSPSCIRRRLKYERSSTPLFLFLTLSSNYRRRRPASRLSYKKLISSTSLIFILSWARKGDLNTMQFAPPPPLRFSAG